MGALECRQGRLARSANLRPLPRLIAAGSRVRPDRPYPAASPAWSVASGPARAWCCRRSEPLPTTVAPGAGEVGGDAIALVETCCAVSTPPPVRCKAARAERRSQASAPHGPPAAWLASRRACRTSVSRSRSAAGKASGIGGISPAAHRRRVAEKAGSGAGMPSSWARASASAGPVGWRLRPACAQAMARAFSVYCIWLGGPPPPLARRSSSARLASRFCAHSAAAAVSPRTLAIWERVL